MLIAYKYMKLRNIFIEKIKNIENRMAYLK